MALIIVTVHGTADASPSDYWEDKTNKWWQIGSPFLKNLLERIDADVRTTRICPFHWSGENNNDVRRAASVDLIRFISNSTTESDQVCIISHSHGANVTVDAFDLFQSDVMITPRNRISEYISHGNAIFSRISCIIAIGAPFYVFKSDITKSMFHTKILDNFDNNFIKYQNRSKMLPVEKSAVFALFFLFGASSILILLFMLFMRSSSYKLLSIVRDSQVQYYVKLCSQLLVPTIFVWISVYMIVILYFVSFAIRYLDKKNNWAAKLLENKDHGIYFKGLSPELNEMTVAIFDRDDEAINGLKSTLQITFDGAPQFRFKLPVIDWIASIIVLSVVNIGISLFYENQFGSEFWFHTLQKQKWPITVADFFSLYYNDGLVISFIVSMHLIFLFYFYSNSRNIARDILIRPVEFIFGFVADAFTTGPLNGLVTRELKNSAFGTRDYKDCLFVTPSTGTYETDSLGALVLRKSWEALPDDTHNALVEAANTGAAASLGSIRTAIGLIGLGGTSSEAIKAATSTFTWKELIHTSYFNHIYVIKVVGYAIQSKLDPRKALELLKQEEKLKGADVIYDQINCRPRATISTEI